MAANKFTRVMAAMSVGVLLIAGAAADKSFSRGGRSIELIGQSGQMRLCRDEDCKDYLKAKMARLVEIDADGKATNNVGQTLASTGTTWSEPVGSIENGATVTTSVFETQLKVGGNGANKPSCDFKLQVKFYENETQVEYANTTLTVPAYALKYTLEISNWPWLSPSNNLTFGVDVLFKQEKETEEGKGEATLETDEVDAPNLLLKHGSFELNSPLYAVIDGTKQDVVHSYDESGNSAELSITFPNFDTLVYDPVIGDTGAAVVVRPVYIVVSALFAALLTAM